ncbi:hypothetical protein AVEN_33954-1 [Araneus ventricosus]|uniref:Uncharacterized protein n=1 Tax=Araneus ventricosus TaxID=182803 RepID=A0A4Y2AFB0_ARAVE|nr:hypothetical protein AVEN_33954-1 [Araneus ventricosus]
MTPPSACAKGQRFPNPKKQYVGLVHNKLTLKVKRPPAGVVRKFGEGNANSQMSSSSSDLGSRLLDNYSLNTKPHVIASRSKRSIRSY